MPPPRPRPDDPDQIDEAGRVIEAVGGAVRPGDAVTVHVDDPEAWQVASFDLDLSVAAVSRAEIRDTTGLFSFMVYWLTPNASAEILMLEGDALALAEAFVGRRLRDQALVDTLIWCRDHYLADQQPELDFDLAEHGLGTWTAFSARAGGTLRLEGGSTPLLPGAAATGLPYQDFTLYAAARSDPRRLRLVQVGDFTYLFQGEVVGLKAVTFLRRTGPAAGR